MDKKGVIYPKVMQNFLMYLDKYTENINIFISHKNYQGSMPNTHMESLTSHMKTSFRLYYHIRIIFL